MSRALPVSALKGVKLGPNSPLRELVKRAKLKDDEHQEQAKLVAWAQFAAPRYPGLELLIAIPNFAGRTGKASARHGARLKAEGRRAGVPDLFLPVCRVEIPPRPFADRVPGLWIEMKSATGRVRPEQAAWHRALREQGYHVAVCRSCEQAQAVILDYLAGTLSGSFV